jgi:hypothetical protein
MEFINLTPHVIRLNDGREFPPSGAVARVSSRHVCAGFQDDIELFDVDFGEIENLPEHKHGNGKMYIVSGMVCAALASQRANRQDVVSPATGHKDCVRINGQVHSVPGFVTSY